MPRNRKPSRRSRRSLHKRTPTAKGRALSRRRGSPERAPTASKTQRIPGKRTSLQNDAMHVGPAVAEHCISDPIWKDQVNTIRTRASMLQDAEELAGMGSWEFDLVTRERWWSEG